MYTSRIRWLHTSLYIFCVLFGISFAKPRLKNRCSKEIPHLHLCRRRSAIWRRCSTTPWCTVATTGAGAWGWDRCGPGRWRRDTTRRRTAASLTCRRRRRTPGAEPTRTRLCTRAPTRLANRPPLYRIDEVGSSVYVRIYPGSPAFLFA